MAKPLDIQDQWWEKEVVAAEVKASLSRQRCWYAYCGPGSTFQLALGRKIRRLRELANKTHPLSYRQNEGQSNLLVSCSWRLDGAEGSPLTSSDDSPDRCQAGIQRLMGHTVRAVDVRTGWDLRVDFSGDLVLNVFPDHVGPSASFDGNWELWRKDQAYLIDTKLTCQVLDRENRPLRLQRRPLWTPTEAEAVNSRR